MFIFGKLQNEFERFSHTIFNEFFLCFFEFGKFLEEFCDDFMVCVKAKAFAESFEEVVAKVI